MTALILCLLLFWVPNVHLLSLRKDQSIIDPKAFASVNDDCDPSTIPVMNGFDMKRFSGKWFELAKTTAGYIDVSDGVWKIEGSNNTHKFLFSGRDNNQHCIRPVKGKIAPSLDPPGTLTLKYQTYSTHVEETIRVLFTDYVSVAVIYTCMYHVHHEKEVCHAAGLFGAIWTRRPHVDLEVYEGAVKYLEMACIHKSTLIIRNVVGPCRIDDLEFRIDDFPAPDYCYQPRDLGSCRGSLQRYYFDPKEKICKIFMYGGCGGNKNNFMSLPECQQKCITASMKDPVCMTTAKCGLHCSPCCTEDQAGCVQCDCEHIIEDDFFNCMKDPAHCPMECEVETFYPGCHVCRCDREHKPDPRNSGACNEVKAVGNCGRNIERFFYNAAEDKCELFAYSGCNGNRNNFNTLQDCTRNCQKTEIVQRAPIPSPGASSALNSSFYLTIIILLTSYFYTCSIV